LLRIIFYKVNEAKKCYEEDFYNIYDIQIWHMTISEVQDPDPTKKVPDPTQHPDPQHYVRGLE
jgi:hypothetical protein